MSTKLADLGQVKHFQDLFLRWKQWLNSRMEENVLLKNKIAEILKNNFNQNSLEEIEEFQNEFIKEDELIHLLRSEVNELENHLHLSILGNTELDQVFTTELESLQKDISCSITRFCILKASFDRFQKQTFTNLENQKF